MAKIILSKNLSIEEFAKNCVSRSNIVSRTSESLDEDGDNRSKTKVTIMESLSGEDGNYVSNIGNMVAGRVGNIFGKGMGGLSNKFGGGTSSWF